MMLGPPSEQEHKNIEMGIEAYIGKTLFMPYLDKVVNWVENIQCGTVL
jgi:hypothetical protein